MHTLDLKTWNRKEHFEFFSQCTDPFFGINVQLEVSHAYQKCKVNNWSFFLYYHYLSTLAANAVEEFRYRIKEGKVVVFEEVHTTTILLREDKTFMFSYHPFTQIFAQFVANAAQEFERAKNSTGIGMNKDTARLNAIHYSALPWISFTGLTHARNFEIEDSCPKISFGKISTNEEKITMPVSVYVHHGLMDGYHVSLYLDKFQELLNE